MFGRNKQFCQNEGREMGESWAGLVVDNTRRYGIVHYTYFTRPLNEDHSISITTSDFNMIRCRFDI